LAAIGIDIAFIVVVFACMFFVRPELSKENDRSLLKFRDPLSLRSNNPDAGKDKI